MAGGNVSFADKAPSGPSVRRHQKADELSLQAAKSSVAKKAPEISKKDEDAVVAALESASKKPDKVEINTAVPGASPLTEDQTDILSIGPKEFDPKTFSSDIKFGPGLY